MPQFLHLGNEGGCLSELAHTSITDLCSTPSSEEAGSVVADWKCTTNCCPRNPSVGLENSQLFNQQRGITQESWRITIQDKHAVAKTVGKSSKQRRRRLLNRGKGERWEESFEQKSTGGKREFESSRVQGGDGVSLAGFLGEKGNFLSSRWSSKVLLTSKVSLFLRSTIDKKWCVRAPPAGLPDPF